MRHNFGLPHVGKRNDILRVSDYRAVAATVAYRF